MQNLIRSLTEGTVEFTEDGHEIRKPPTALHLRAARAITQLSNSVEQLALAEGQLNERVQDLYHDITVLQDKLNEANRIISRTSSVSDVRHDKEQGQDANDSAMGCADGNSPGSDSDGEGSGTN